MSREDISSFLKREVGKEKPEVLTDFVSFAISQGVSVDKLGKLIADLRSFPEWTWGE